MCGITGYSSKLPVDPGVMKVLILYARDRGTDSTGIMINDKIKKWWNKDFHSKNGDAYTVLYGSTFPKKKDYVNTDILVHCRSRSVGIVSKDNTHPFEYIDNNGDIYYFTHNGTIKNIDEMALKYNVTTRVGATDSEAFGEILLASNFEALLEYKGTAAFSLYNATTRTFYLWKGYSNHDNTKGASVERPLHWSQIGNRFYYHSTAESIASATDQDEEIYEFPHNTLTLVKNSKQIASIIYDRSQVNSGYIAPKTVSGTGSTSYNNYPSVITSDYIPEKSPQNEAGKKVYFWKSRYYLNGHILNGHYKLDAIGAVTKTGSDFYFWNGLMMKDEAALNIFKGKIATKKVESVKDDEAEAKLTAYEISALLHPDTIYFRKSYQVYGMYRQGNWVANIWVVPLFGYYEYFLSKSNSSITTRKIVATEAVDTDKELVFQQHQPQYNQTEMEKLAQIERSLFPWDQGSF